MPQSKKPMSNPTTEPIKAVTKTALDYFRQNQPVYTENELQEAIKIAHEAGVEAERKRLAKIIDLQPADFYADFFNDVTDALPEDRHFVIKELLDWFMPLHRALTNQGETK